MKKFFRLALSSHRKRRCMVLGAALWLLRQLLDVEEIEMRRCSDFLDSLAWGPDSASRRSYTAAEEELYSCEHAYQTLVSAIDDLDFAY